MVQEVESLENKVGVRMKVVKSRSLWTLFLYDVSFSHCAQRHRLRAVRAVIDVKDRE